MKKVLKACKETLAKITLETSRLKKITISKSRMMMERQRWRGGESERGSERERGRDMGGRAREREGDRAREREIERDREGDL